MNLSLIADLILGVAWNVFDVRGDVRAKQYIDKILAAKAQGADVEAHMEQVAEMLRGNGDLDYDAQLIRLDATVSKFLNR